MKRLKNVLTVLISGLNAWFWRASVLETLKNRTDGSVLHADVSRRSRQCCFRIPQNSLEQDRKATRRMTADGTKVMYSISGPAQTLESIAHDEGNRLPHDYFSYPTKYLLPGRYDSSLIVIQQQMKVSTAITGIARATGMRGSA